MAYEGWLATELGEVVSFRSGGTPSKQQEEYWGGNHPWVSAKDLKQHFLETSELTLSDAGWSVAKHAPKNAVLILVRGMTLHKDFPVGIAVRKLAFNQDIKALVPKASLDPLFLSYLLVSNKGRIRNLVDTAGHGTGRLDTDQLKSFPLHIPIVEEQRKIARILSTWDKAIETVERLIENSKAQKKALMQQLLTGKRRFPGFSKEWQEAALGSLGTTYGGLSGKSKEDFGRGKPFIPYINIFNNSKIDIAHFDLVDISPTEKQSCVRYGDIFFTTSSETPEEVGMSSVLLDQVSDLYLNSFCFGFRLHNFDTLSPEYARYVLRSEQVRRIIIVLAQGSTRFNLSKKELMKINLKLPCMEEQKAITEVLVNAEEHLEALAQKSLRLQEMKKALMQQLLTGKRRVKVDEA